MPHHTQDVTAEDENTDDSPADLIGQSLAAHCPDVYTGGPAQDVSPRSAVVTGVTQSQTCHATSRGFDADPAYLPQPYTDCQTWLLDHRHSDTFIPARQMVDPQTHAVHCSRIHDIVRSTGVFNFIGAKAPLLHEFNIYLAAGVNISLITHTTLFYVTCWTMGGRLDDSHCHMVPQHLLQQSSVGQLNL